MGNRERPVCPLFKKQAGEGLSESCYTCRYLKECAIHEILMMLRGIERGNIKVEIKEMKGV